MLFWYLVVQFAVLLYLTSCRNERSRFFLSALLILNLFLSIASTPLAGLGLETSLNYAEKSKTVSAPNFIFVLGGGYIPGVVPDEDVLIVESQRRVLHGVSIWKRYPNARIVFSGAAYDYDGLRGTDRLAKLMAESALSWGVPSSNILLETNSDNTRQHPIEALKLPGVTNTTPVAVVTSGWHMRRAQREFCRHFEQVQSYPAPHIRRSLNWKDFIPDASALDKNTTLLREWIGILWYTIISPQEQTIKC